MIVLKWAGIAMVSLAVVLGAAAYRLASQSAAAGQDNEADAAGSARIVVALRSLSPGVPIRSDDVALQRVSIRPEGAYSRLEEVTQRAPSAALSRGEPLLAKHFEPDSAISRMLQPDERAVAVKIDGVTGLGGFVQPGDRVDVLFFLRRDGREVSETQARTLLRNVRVLAFGTQVEASGSSGPALDARTAVLAVPQADAPLLLLGDTAGKLRLALRHAGDPASGGAAAPATLAELTGQHSAPSARPQVPGVTVIRGPERSAPARRRAARR